MLLFIIGFCSRMILSASNRDEALGSRTRPIGKNFDQVKIWEEERFKVGLFWNNSNVKLGLQLDWVCPEADLREIIYTNQQRNKNEDITTQSYYNSYTIDTDPQQKLMAGKMWNAIYIKREELKNGTYQVLAFFEEDNTPAEPTTTSKDQQSFGFHSIKSIKNFFSSDSQKQVNHENTLEQLEAYQDKIKESLDLRAVAKVGDQTEGGKIEVTEVDLAFLPSPLATVFSIFVEVPSLPPITIKMGRR